MYNEDNCPNCITCRYCKYYMGNAEIESVISICKRIDHKKVKFAVPWFKSYDCDGIICCEFEPKNPEYADFKEWTTVEDYKDIRDKANEAKRSWKDGNRTISFTINGDTSIRYNVKFLDFFYGTMFDGNKLKAVSKTYSKRTREDAGYKLITEKIDGVIID